jgi:hypothetical protein
LHFGNWKEQTVSELQISKVVVVTSSTKNVGLAIILTVLFGPLGMLYSTIWGGVIMTVVNVIVGFFTVGFGLVITWPINVVWAAVAANSYNKKLVSGQREY